MQTFFTFILIGFLLAFGCGGDETPPEETVETPESDGCEHFEEGPFADLTAAELASAPALQESHTKTTVSLTDGRFLTFPSVEVAETFFFVGSDVSLTVRDDAMEEVVVETEGAVSECSDLIEKKYVFDLEVGTYSIEFGPTDTDEVALVFLTDSEHHDE